MSTDLYSRLVDGFWGFVIGAGLAMIVGFSWGGWNTSTTTQKMSDEAVLTSHSSICIAQFMGTPDYKARLKEFQGMEGYKKSEFIEQYGWDKMPGQDKSSWGVASACVAGIEARLKTGT
jgi:hypothetical protein